MHVCVTGWVGVVLMYVHVHMYSGVCEGQTQVACHLQKSLLSLLRLQMHTSPRGFYMDAETNFISPASA